MIDKERKKRWEDGKEEGRERKKTTAQHSGLRTYDEGVLLHKKQTLTTHGGMYSRTQTGARGCHKFKARAI